jgi:SIR2-like domain
MKEQKETQETKIHFQQGKTNLLSLIIDGNENVNSDDQQKKVINLIREKISELFNMKNVHFLFGSGTSVNAIPTMAGLFKAVKEKVDGLNDKDDEFVIQEFEQITEKVKDENLEEILGILYSHSGYLNGKNDKEEKLKTCNTLIKLIEEVIFTEINVDFSSTSAKNTLKTYQDFYQKVALRNKDLSRISIFTTNNDLFNETALNSLNIHYINGFNSGINRYFNPALFKYTFSKRMDTSIDKFEPVENMVNLYKIHGSVNWVEDDENQNTFFKIKEISIPDNTKENVLIYPTPTKQNKSLGSPYVEMFREFQGKLLEPLSALFVIGYSFSDEHVNNVIYQALATNSTMNLVIINDVSDKPIFNIDDNRIYKIWEEAPKEYKDEKLHFFKPVVEKLLPNVNAFKAEDNSLNEFIKFYKTNLSK